VRFRKALVDTIQELNNLNIRSAMNSGADWLGAFYEVFLKYANWAQDLGIVLTPRHVTRFVADVMDVQSTDLVLDLTCGTGGFLVAAFDYVKRRFNEQQVQRFKENCLFGIEQDAGVASLAIVNMIFRGDGKNNIIEGNCFSKFLEKDTRNNIATAKYSATQSLDPPIKKVMMNPPFALKKSDEKEFKFVDQALNQMEDGGILFSVLPYSTMVKPGAYKDWRKNQLLPNNTLLAVLTFPIDLFYPVGVTTVGVFIKKGFPHPKGQKVMWLRALNDGLLKSKGKRLPNSRAKNDLVAIRDNLKAFLRNPDHPIPNIHQFSKAQPIEWSDPQFELVPEAYLDQAETTLEEVEIGLNQSVRDTLAFLIRLNRIEIRPDLLDSSITSSLPLPTELNWKRFKITDLFDLGRGNFHSIADLDPGEYLTISRISTDNGLVGFFDKPAKAEIWKAKTITVSTVTGDAFVQPLPFIVTDNVVLLNEKNGPLKLTSLYFIQFMINQVRWRYSYGRQCYKTKFAETEIILPIKENGKLDEDSMAAFVRNVRYWRLVESMFSSKV
jgi:type I restriction enzyme M protein